MLEAIQGHHQIPNRKLRIKGSGHASEQNSLRSISGHQQLCRHRRVYLAYP
ncbi:hypothetical protein D3C71_2111820 [compost metagenome]